MDPEDSVRADTKPPLFNYIISFLLVGVAWGFTTPFIRRAAADFNARQEARLKDQAHPLQSQTPAQTNEREGEREGEGISESERTSEGEEEEEEEEEGEGTDDERAGLLNQDQANKQERQGISISWAKTKITTLFWTVVNLLRTPAYSIPLVINLTGSIWFFLLVGKHELSLTVPLANSSAFLFTVLGEWYVERKVITLKTWLGMALVLAGIGICVQAKS